MRHDAVGYTVALVGRQAMAAFQARIEALGLSPREFALMTALEGEGDPSQRELAGSLGLPASRVVGLVDRLERAGFVRRAGDETDRRAHRIRLTPEGARHLARAHEEATALDRRLTAGLDAGEAAELTRLLRHVSEALAAEGAGRSLVW